MQEQTDSTNLHNTLTKNWGATGPNIHAGIITKRDTGGTEKKEGKRQIQGVKTQETHQDNTK